MRVTATLVGIGTCETLQIQRWTTVAAIVGAAVGALHGHQGLSPRWIDNLLGRTADTDDGRAFQLLAAAKKKWEMAVHVLGGTFPAEAVTTNGWLRFASLSRRQWEVMVQRVAEGRAGWLGNET